METRMKKSDKNLMAALKILDEMTARGELEQSLKEAFVRGVARIRRAGRSRDPAKLWEAINELARLFLKSEVRAVVIPRRR